MPYPPQVFSLDGHAFGLTVSGVQVVGSVPTSVAPIRFDMPSATSLGSLTFTVEDAGETPLPYGSVVRFTDNRLDAAHGVEMLTNGTFDSDLSGWTVDDATSSVWSANAGPEGTGDGALVTTGDGTGTEEVHQTVTGVAHRDILRLSVDIYAASGATDAQVAIRWLDGADASLGDVLMDLPGATTLHLPYTGAYFPIEGYFTAPVETAKARVRLKLRTSVTNEVRFDNVSLSLHSPQKVLMSGPLLDKRVWRSAAAYQQTECKVVGWGWFLDNREVQSFSWGTNDHRAVLQLLREWGGPVQATGEYVSDGGANAGTATARSTVRSVIESMDAPTDGSWLENLPYYVDNDRQLHKWDASTPVDTSYDFNVYGGDATSIGDLGTFIPDDLIIDTGSESHLNLVYPWYDSGGGAAQVLFPTRGQYAAPGTSLQQPWEAGDVTASLDISSDNYVTGMTQVGDYLRNFAGLQTVISFDTIQYDGWLPHQRITIHDSVITDGAEETWYIDNVSGTIDERNVIEWHVLIGNPRRSLVQTVVDNA